MVPQRRSPTDLDSFRNALPVHERQGEIIQLIRDNRVVLVVGETGSGKTTQVGLPEHSVGAKTKHIPVSLRYDVVQIEL